MSQCLRRYVFPVVLAGETDEFVIKIEFNHSGVLAGEGMSSIDIEIIQIMSVVLAGGGGCIGISEE